MTKMDEIMVTPENNLNSSSVARCQHTIHILYSHVFSKLYLLNKWMPRPSSNALLLLCENNYSTTSANTDILQPTVEIN